MNRLCDSRISKNETEFHPGQPASCNHHLGMTIFPNFEQKVDFKQSQFQKLSVTRTQFYLFFIAGIRGKLS